MRLLLLLLLIAPTPGAAAARPKREKPRKEIPAPVPAPQVSSETAQSLPLFAPTTGPVTVPLILERFEEFDRRMQTLAADFRQSVRVENSGVAQTLEGSLEYKKPNRLHLEHRLPEPQTLVADGVWLWIWRRSTNQVIQTRLEEWKKSEPLAQGIMDFGGYAELLKRYEVSIATVSTPDSEGHRKVELVLRPKEKADFLLRLRLSTKDFFPADAELRAGQMSVHSLFEKIRFNPELPESRFQFSPPPGADVFQNLRPPRSQP